MEYILRIEHMELIQKRGNCYGCSMTGVKRAVAHNKGAVLLLHSPAACGQVLREKDNNGVNTCVALNNYEAPVFISCLNNEDAIFGANKKLELYLRQIIEQYKPEYAVVGNSCVIGVIGDDVENVCQQISDEYNIPVFSIPCFGFMNGGYEKGLTLTSQYLMEYYVKRMEARNNKVTLIGIVDKSRNHEYFFIEDVLKCFGLDINCVFPGDATIEQMKSIGESKALVLCSRYNMLSSVYFKIADTLQQATGLELVSVGDPVGYEKALRWVNDMGHALRVSSEVISKTHDRIKKEFEDLFAYYRNFFAGKTAIIYISMFPYIDTNLDWVFDLLENVGVCVEGVVIPCDTNDAELKKIIAYPKLFDCWIETADTFAGTQADFIFALRADKKFEQLVPIPYVNPPFGILGAKEFFAKMLKIEMIRKHRKQYDGSTSK